MRYFTSLGVLCLGVLIVGLSAGRTAKGCAWVTKVGGHVEVTDESALIVWDEKAKKQHFIRRAAFDAKVPYFGFLVPSPSRPELAEAPDKVFTDLSSWTRPEVRTEYRYFTPAGWLRERSKLGNGFGPPSAVTVLEEKCVGGLDAAVLKATDARALNEWLAQHGYSTRPALEAWLARYIKADWVITAFKVAKEDPSSTHFEAKAVRMSFTTEQPFFPYSEPPDKRDETYGPAPRSLRVFLIATARMQGALDAPRVPWSGKAVWASPLGNPQREAVTKHLGAEAVPLPEKAWLSVFDDFGSPRNGVADVYFSPSWDQSPLRRLPIIYFEDVIYPPWSLLLSCVLAAASFCVFVRVMSIVHGRQARQRAKR
jgi:hypothetical protein